MDKEEVIFIPKSFLNKMNRTELIEFAVKMFYKHEPAEAKAFEMEVKIFEGLPQRAENLQMLYKVPLMVFHFLRQIDHDFWHPERGKKNYKLFGDIYTKVKVKRERTTTKV